MYSAYDELAPQLITKGLYPLPIGPGTKKPQAWDARRGEWVGLVDWTDPSRAIVTAPQPGAGVGVRMSERLCTVDLDDDVIAIALFDILPDTQVRKIGRRGESLLFRHEGLSSRKYKINGAVVCEILATGTQTVIPPTIHPDTNAPYVWSGAKSLLDVSVEDLPLLTPDHIAKLEDTLAHYGYTPEPEAEQCGDTASSPFRALNEAALGNLAAWVPVLGLYKCRRRSGRWPSYEAVATWRQSSTEGKTLEDRDPNLRMVKSGIKDFGDGRGYTPIDLVMAARGWSLNEAIGFLDEHLGWSTGGPDIEQEAPAAEARSGAGENKKAGEAPRKLRFKLTAFSNLRPGPEPLYLVDELIPVAGLVDVWGKAKCFKSFWTLDVMLHVAMGWEYRDRYVRQGVVVYCAFEGAHGYKKRVEALRRHDNIADDADVPLYVMPGQANLIADHKLLIRELGEQLGDIKPVAVVLDTLNKSLVGSENKDIDMGAYVRAPEAIRDAFSCVVIIVHHCGYDDTRPRGHSSLPGAVDAQLAVTREGDIVTITVEMMRDGPEDTQVSSRASSVVVGVDQNGKELTSLVMTPSDPNEVNSRERLPRATTTYMKALHSALAKNGRMHQPSIIEPPVKAVPGLAVKNEFTRIYLDDDDEEDQDKRLAKKRNAFRRGRLDALERDLVVVQRQDESDDGYLVWINNDRRV